MSQTILVVDDERNVRWTLREWLELAGHQVLEAPDAAALRRTLGEASVDLVLLDLTLPDASGLELLRDIRASHAALPVIIVTANATADTAVVALKQGASDYITKPFKMDSLLRQVGEVLQRSNGQGSTRNSAPKERFGVHNLLGESACMREIRDFIRKLAAGDSTTVLLLGESGTGKDMVARALHYESARVDKPFMNITCTALPELLMESELFGYEKGAFTNALARKRGLFELADQGTVFLDEVGDMPPLLQAKLLRVLEDRSFKRIGGAEDIHVQVRVIAATNRDLQQRIEQHKFREDLYYRISTVPLTLPALRHRPGDIPLLAQHFLALYNREFHRNFDVLAPAVLEKLRTYAWPGNVRELRNIMERAVLLASGHEIRCEDVVLGRTSPPARPAPPRCAQLPEAGCNLETVEKELLAQALARSMGNQTRAAALVGITREQMRYKMKKHGFD